MPRIKISKRDFSEEMAQQLEESLRDNPEPIKLSICKVDGCLVGLIAYAKCWIIESKNLALQNELEKCSLEDYRKHFILPGGNK